jgi:hypothetical protein
MSSILEIGNTFFLTGAGAIVTMPEPKSLFVTPATKPTAFVIEKTKKEYRGIVSWGENNKLPMELLEKVYSNPIISSAMEFKSLLTYGDGIMIVKRDENGKFKPYFDNKEINDFFLDNDINGNLLEQATDLQVFYNVFPEIILNSESSPKVVELNHKEATFSRLELMNPDNGEIENHFYSAQWGDKAVPDDIVATPMLSSRNPIKDLKYKLGIEKDPLNKVKETKERRFIIPLNFPTPGRFYYRKPYWVSILENWYDFAQAIPKFKTALLNNGMVFKFHVEIHPQFFEKLYQKLGITEKKEKEATQKKWLEQLNAFLSKPENAGKTFISDLVQVGDKLESMMKITSVKNEYVGGEYLPDLEEVSNILSYGMGVHPSLIGSSPGKNKTINGTEARELFMIKQALLKPFRDRLLFPLYLIKAINKWPDDVHFIIPNLELTTIDQGTGAKKTISQPAIENPE